MAIWQGRSRFVGAPQNATVATMTEQSTQTLHPTRSPSGIRPEAITIRCPSCCGADASVTSHSSLSKG